MIRPMLALILAGAVAVASTPPHAAQPIISSAYDLQDANYTTLVVAVKTARPAFNAAARGVRPPAAKITPTMPRVTASKPAPAPRGPTFGARGLQPVLGGARQAAPSRAIRSPRTPERAGSLRAKVQGITSGRAITSRSQFQATAGRGTLRPAFRNAATRSTPKQSIALGARSPRPTLRPAFKQASAQRALRQNFRESAGYRAPKGLTVWRTHSGAVSGRYSTPVKPTSSQQARHSLALPNSNRATRLQKYVTTGNEIILRGPSRVAPNFGRRGGGQEILFARAPAWQGAGWLKGGLSSDFRLATRGPMEYFR